MWGEEPLAVSQSAASWGVLAMIFDGRAADGMAEAQRALEEFEEMRGAVEEQLEKALSTNRSTLVDGRWSHAMISTEGLLSASEDVQAFPRQSDEGRALAKRAAIVIDVRTALTRCDWNVASSWEGLAVVLESSQFVAQCASDASDELLAAKQVLLRLAF